ncbi:alpha-L-fucosidase [Sphaerisporangium album]|uniref:Alpha-L-fucosidase n=1 Tax=Sphaerisporangium album TaxID=509200 RepID=A0A367F7N4_9ACTN|nr:discoidin domain-containing protein [Sphaerisporangium album]RCG25939.1 alpha-L-fucosidase [Sphaerisporangium album]
MAVPPTRRGRLTAALVAVTSLVLGMCLATPARADLQNPRQTYLRNSVAGLFLHWGERTSPQHTNCAQWEADVTNGGWTPTYWVNEARKLHAQYLVLATFHSRLGYARPWPSSIPGSCRTGRDFLGELITAASAQNLKVILYMTDDPQWHNEGLSSGSWLNSSAYSSYKGHSVDLTTRDGFGEFSYDNFFEVMDRYPNLAGFWIDNDNAYWESHNLYEQIYQRRPNYTISNNNEDTPIMDMISNEQKTGMTPSYDYTQAVYTAAPRLIEADFKLPSTGAWWYDGSNPSVDRKLTLGRLISNAGSSVKALMAETAQVNGRFPSNQEAFNTFADGYLDQIWESLNGTEGGGYMYGGLKPGFWNNGAHGVTTISKSDPNLHYIHVVTPPTSGSSLQVRDNGYRITSVTNLRTGAALAFTQANGTLTINGVSSWDPYDTVFKVTSSGREGVYAGVTVSATASASGHAASAAGDGDYLTYWDSNKTTPVSLDFDLGSSKPVKYIGVNQREDSVSYARSATEQSARIRDYRVYVSSNGTSWGSPVKTGTLPSHRGVQFVDVSATTRYVRLEVVNTHAASTDTTRYKRLRVDEAWVGGSYPGGGPGGDTTLVEAENGTLNGSAAVASCSTCLGGAKVRFIGNNANNYATLTVNASTAGTKQVTVYAEVSGTRSFFVSVNGGAGVEVPVTGTDWYSPTSVTVPLSLTAGANTLRFYNNGANAPDLDRITVG